jgi:heme oxygenase
VAVTGPPGAHDGPPSLAAALRDHVQALHVQAERSGIINDVLRGHATIGGYMLLLRNLLPCYEAMERALEQHRRSPILQLFARPELYRAEAIKSDLARFNASWRQDLPLLPQAAAYQGDIEACTRGAGTALIGHAYARYLGDLSGGMVLRRLLAPMLPPDRQPAGLDFHEFPGVSDVSACKLEFRSAIDRAGALISDWPCVLAAAAAAFRRNMDLSCAVKAVERL